MDKKEVLIHAIPWINLQNIMLSKRHQTQKANIPGFHLYEMPRIGRSILTENRSVVILI